jgi:hypothetical protein
MNVEYYKNNCSIETNSIPILTTELHPFSDGNIMPRKLSTFRQSNAFGGIVRRDGLDNAGNVRPRAGKIDPQVSVDSEPAGRVRRVSAALSWPGRSPTWTLP